MPAKISTHVFKGMLKDTNVANASNEYLLDAKNIRFTPSEDLTLFSITNERGNTAVTTDNDIQGTLVGWYVVGEIIMVFTHLDTTDRIYRLTSSDNFDTVNVDLMYEGNLNLDPQHPLEFTSYYEAENVIKLYWVDGKNQLRFMNIMEELKNIADPNETPIYRAYTDSNEFNTTPELQLNETVIVELIEGSGEFPAGVILFAFTYVNKLGAETNIFYVTELKSILYKNNRVASPLEYINCAFKINIEGIDLNYDYIRCYQLLRTSLDAQPTCLILNEIPVSSNTATFYSTNVGALYDPTALLFLKYPIKPYTLDLKSNTLFLGNIDESIMDVSKEDIAKIREYFNQKDDEDNYYLTFSNVSEPYYIDMSSSAYPINADADAIRTFKSGEIYRIGVLLLNKYGVWTLPIYLRDIKANCKQVIDGDNIYSIGLIFNSHNTEFPLDSLSDDAKKEDYKRFRFVMVNPSVGDRNILSQGIVIPTMYEVSDRVFNSPHAYNSWFLRPFNSNVASHQNELIPAGKANEAEILASRTTTDADAEHTLKWYTLQTKYDSPYRHSDDILDDASATAILYYTLDYEENISDNTFLIWLTCWIVKNNLQLKYNKIQNVLLTSTYVKSNCTEVVDDKTKFNQTGCQLITGDIGAALAVAGLPLSYFNPNLNADIQNEFYQQLGNAVIESTKFTYDNKIEQTGLDLTEWIDLDAQASLISSFPFNAGELSEFRVDHSILNLYSPDINNQYYEISHNSDISLNLIGYTEVSSVLDNIYLEIKNIGSSASSTKTSLFNFSRIDTDNLFDFTRGLYSDSIVSLRIPQNGEKHAYRDHSTISLKYNFSIDPAIFLAKSVPSDIKTELDISPNLFNFAVYPWHSTGSLNNEDNSEGENRSATYSKTFAKSWICNKVEYYDEPYIYKAHEDGLNECTCGTCVVCNDTNSVVVLQLDGQTNTYIANPDIARTFIKLENGLHVTDKPHLEYGYDLYIIENNEFRALEDYYAYTIHFKENGDKDHKQIYSPNETSYEKRYPQANNNFTSYKSLIYGTDPIQIKYNSDTHVVIPINRYNDNNVLTLTTLPSLSIKDDIQEPTDTPTYYPLWDNSRVYKDEVPILLDSNNNRILCNTNKPYFHIGELKRTVTSRYGGVINIEDDESYESDNPILISNIFIPVMESKTISSLTTENVETTYGDTWYGRWDCLKTLEKTNQDEQSVHDYVSIMIESHINLNGRYDSYRNFYDLTLVNAQNANKFNDVYNQMDNFWSYKVTPNYTNTYYYPNQVTWSLTKNSGSLVDEWTRVTAANVLEFDGNEGLIRKILNYNDLLLVFQDRCISQILYNEQMQMTTTEGVPVEISNSQKVTGVRKLLDDVGCINKWSINASANGIAFIDNVNSSMIFWSLGSKESSAPVNLTNSKAFISFMKKYNLFDVWNPEDFSNFVTFNDKLNNEIYFVNDTLCLVFSLTMLEFTSFYSYEHTPAMFNIRDDFYSLYPVDSPRLWKNFKGEYNKFYGKEPKDNSYITFIDKGESFLADKTFTNINYTQDAYQVSDIIDNDDFEDYEDKYYKYLPNRTFNQLKIWTPFLKVEKTLELVEEDMFNIQRKFRTWAIQIDKDSDNNRIRNNWAKFKLTFVPDGVDTKIELMNINVLSLE